VIINGNSTHLGQSNWNKALFFSIIAHISFLVILIHLETTQSYITWPLSRICLITVPCVSLVVTSMIIFFGLYSFSALYSLLFMLFHFGIVLPQALGFPLPLPRYNWFGGDVINRAILLANVGFLALGTGALLMRLLARDSSRKKKDAPQGDVISTVYGTVGFSLVFIGCLGWYWIVIKSGGLGVLLGSYVQYRETVDSPLVHYVWLLQGLGWILVASHGEKAWIMRTGVIFLIWTISALPLGLRGGVLFPLAVSLPLLAKRGFRIPTKYSIIGAVVLLMVIAGVRSLRTAGVADAKFSDLTYSPLDALYEMGSQIRVVGFVCRWRDEGDPPAYGGTYIRPFERALTALSRGGGASQELPDDDLLMNLYVAKREGLAYGPGFSPVAEGFVNFNQTGIVMFMLILGIVFSLLDCLAVSAKTLAYSGVIFLPFVIEVRNAFTPVPFQLALGISIVFLLGLCGRFQKKIDAGLPVNHSRA
jgi:hypothetical protein